MKISQNVYKVYEGNNTDIFGENTITVCYRHNSEWVVVVQKCVDLLQTVGQVIDVVGQHVEAVLIHLDLVNVGVVVLEVLEDALDGTLGVVGGQGLEADVLQGHRLTPVLSGQVLDGQLEVQYLINTETEYSQLTLTYTEN